MHSMHSFAAAAAFKENERRRKKAEYGHKAYLYITRRYLTFQFDLNDTWLSREVHREQVCVPLRRNKQLGRSWPALGQIHPQRSITSTSALRLGTRLRCHEVKCQVTNKLTNNGSAATMSTSPAYCKWFNVSRTEGRRDGNRGNCALLLLKSKLKITSILNTVVTFRKGRYEVFWKS